MYVMKWSIVQNLTQFFCIRVSCKGYDSIRKIAGQQTKSKKDLEQTLQINAYLVSLMHLGFIQSILLQPIVSQTSKICHSWRKKLDIFNQETKKNYVRQHFNTDNIGPSYDMMILSDFRTFVAFSTAMFLQIRQKKTYFAEKVLNFYQRNLIQNPSWSHNNSQEPENILFLPLLYFWCYWFHF